MYDCPLISVVTTGRRQLWVVTPVKYCKLVDETVIVVVPADVAVVVNPGRKLLD